MPLHKKVFDVKMLVPLFRTSMPIVQQIIKAQTNKGICSSSLSVYYALDL